MLKDQSFIDLTKLRQLEEILRVRVLVSRFSDKSRHTRKVFHEKLPVREIAQDEEVWILPTKKKAFKEDICELSHQNAVEKHSVMRDLHAFFWVPRKNFASADDFKR
ncbi:hypothetical protein HPB50_005598 [Hyalomma asiaticum]|uniref:Uncharacterized protein n=1 Tax=Hyalomma asiaticum TaxID=266040 RepID=A0ACB7RXY8_HYAAI|nr:hypothetical protein HPB50_005598 [Hyalomma asiaticum]